MLAIRRTAFPTDTTRCGLSQNSKIEKYSFNEVIIKRFKKKQCTALCFDSAVVLGIHQPS